jgi:hypothetical protein
MQNLEPNINELIAALQPLVDRMRTTDSAVKVHGQVRWRRNEPLTTERMHSPSRDRAPLWERSKIATAAMPRSA